MQKLYPEGMGKSSHKGDVIPKNTKKGYVKLSS